MMMLVIVAFSSAYRKPKPGPATISSGTHKVSSSQAKEAEQFIGSSLKGCEQRIYDSMW